MRHTVFGFVACCAVLCGQPSASRAEPAKVRIPAGARSASLVVKLTQIPDDSDRIVFSYNSNRLIATLVTPDGLRIAADGPDASLTSNQPPLGSTDAGSTGFIWLKKTWKPGNYTLILTSPGLPTETEASVWYLNEREQERQLANAPARPQIEDPRFQVVGLPYLRCFAGERLKLQLHFFSGPALASVKFEVFVETRPRLPHAATLTQPYGPPVVTIMPMHLALGPDGDYHGILPPFRSGVVRLKIVARGKTQAGRLFTVSNALK